MKSRSFLLVIFLLTGLFLLSLTQTRAEAAVSLRAEITETPHPTNTPFLRYDQTAVFPSESSTKEAGSTYTPTAPVTIPLITYLIGGGLLLANVFLFIYIKTRKDDAQVIRDEPHDPKL